MRIARVALPGMEQIVEAEVSDDGERLFVGGKAASPAAVRFAPCCDGLIYGVVLNDRMALDALGEALWQPPYAAPARAPCGSVTVAP
jgi:hypothetical protein